MSASATQGGHKKDITTKLLICLQLAVPEPVIKFSGTYKAKYSVGIKMSKQYIKCRYHVSIARSEEQPTNPKFLKAHFIRACI